MVFEDVLQSPLGLLALLSIIPLVVLYLVRPSPATMALPTFRFLVVDEGRDCRRRALERLRRELLFLLQLLVLISLALAGPYVQVTRGVPADEVGVVVDASASMATRFGAETRFDRAVDVARSSVAGTTTIVLSGPVPEVLASGAPHRPRGRRCRGRGSPARRATCRAPSHRRPETWARAAISSSRATSRTRATGPGRSPPRAPRD
jgi:hypothetical protein